MHSPHDSPHLSLEAVGVALGRRTVLHQVDLEVGRGVTGLVGRNGAGKSTLMHAVTGVVTVDRGVIRRDGEDIGSAAVMRRHRRTLGWLPQDPGLPPRMKVREFVLYAAWLKEVPAKRRAGAASDAIDSVDMGSLANRPIGKLSGGERRRAALAAAMVNDPPLLLLDEPTAGLDPVQREQFLEKVRALARKRAVVIATHLLEDLELSADRWIAINGGWVVASGVLDRSSQDAVTAGLKSIRGALIKERPGQ